MNTKAIAFTASEQTLVKTSGADAYASNTVGYIEATFDLDTNWDGFDSVRAVWKSQYYTISAVLDAYGKCLVPAEVKYYKSKVFVNLVGSNVEDDVLVDRLTTYPVLAFTIDAEAEVEGTETTDITPSQFEQFVDQVEGYAESAAEDAQSIAESAAQIEQNAEDIADLKEDLQDTYNGLIPFIETVKGQYITSSTGAFQNDSTSTRTGYIKIPSGATKIEFTSAEQSSYNAFYDSNYNRVAGLSYNAGTSVKTVPNNAVYFAVSCSTANFGSLKAKIPNSVDLSVLQLNVQQQNSDINDLDDDIDSVNTKLNDFIHYSENIFDIDTVTPNSYMSLSGLQTGEDYAPWFTSALIHINGETKLQSNIPLNSVVFFNADNTIDTTNSKALLYNTVTLPMTIPTTAKSMRVSSRMTYINNDIMMNFGEELLPYIEYGGVQLADGVLKENPVASKVNFAKTETDYLTDYKMSISKNLCVSYYAIFDTFASLKIGFTNTNDYANNYTDYFEITATSLILHREGLADITWAHELTITNYISIQITFDFTLNFTLNIETNGGTFTKTNYIYLGKRYFPFAVLTGSNIKDKKLSMTCKDTKRNIALFGDSYVSNNSARWIYYLPQESKDNILINGYAGESSASASPDFDSVLKIASAKYVVWCLGMNDGSDTNDTTPSASWLTNVQHVISVCESKNITPILATIPSVPSINNRAKSNWVRNSGYEYIDFAKAVESGNSGNWYNGMLSNDNVHPTEEGAKALYAKAVTDFPQLLIYSN